MFVTVQMIASTHILYSEELTKPLNHKDKGHSYRARLSGCKTRRNSATLSFCQWDKVQYHRYQLWQTFC